ncbi:heavy-metal-associated domain-containing protein [Lutibacter aestuarii]|uniref:Copper chaperone CopZ n=2 Tax=Lutibacter TaxID=358023 RepID=A0A1H2TY00_9FLAO|nr:MULTISPECIES: heavy-metal-associated domain-containing protein [Lutibacter]UMB52439.1 heavy-metal-associated domain-containing protein [Lutibacter sp. A64]SDW48638.1 Copper chaperone CopZ [Lutibacter oricola]
MKHIKSILIIIFIFTINITFAQLKTEEFKVEGKCEMCKNRIEKAAKSVKGIKTANWNVESKMLKITFDLKESSAYEVEQAVAKVGHSTKYVSASKKAYNSLPSCCKYELTDAKKGCNHCN